MNNTGGFSGGTEKREFAGFTFRETVGRIAANREGKIRDDRSVYTFDSAMNVGHAGLSCNEGEINLRGGKDIAKRCRVAVDAEDVGLAAAVFVADEAS